MSESSLVLDFELIQSKSLVMEEKTFLVNLLPSFVRILISFEIGEKITARLVLFQ